MVAIPNAGEGQRLVLAEAFTPLFVVEGIAHRLPIGAHDWQVHLGDDVRENSLHRHRIRDDRVDAFCARLVEESDPRAFSIFCS